jgi:hypothetical protein
MDTNDLWLLAPERQQLAQGAEEARAWEGVVPSSAERLFAEHLLQLRHRRRVELASVRLSFFGPILGLVVVLSFLGTAAWLVSDGHGVEGTFLGTVDIASLAAVFALGIQTRHRSVLQPTHHDGRRGVPVQSGPEPGQPDGRSSGGMQPPNEVRARHRSSR